MKIVCIGGGPSGLYFSILMKKLDPSCDIQILERNKADDTFGFGVVFSDATMDNLADADRETFDAITREFAHWDDIDIHFGGRVVRSAGHGFAGMSRKRLLQLLSQRAQDLGVSIHFETEVEDLTQYRSADLVVGADGVNSLVRRTWSDEFKPDIQDRPNLFVWLGTTFPFEAFTFYFKENEHGLWRVHAYRYAENESTFIVECTEETFRRSGLAVEDEDATIEYCQALFADELEGHPLQKNRSLWRRFPTIRNGSWSHDNVALMGDAVHTAHFSIGSGTKLAMEDAIALQQALAAEPDVASALKRYELDRRESVESLQRAAQVSLQWFEETERYVGLDPIQFGFSLLTRSLRISHENLRVRDPQYVAQVDEWFAASAEAQSGQSISRPGGHAPPPMFTPYRLRDMVLENRVVVSPMCQYLAEDGTIDDWHLVHLGSRAIGGAGLVMTEMTDVSADARITPGCAGLYQDRHADAWRRVTDFVHRHSNAKVGVQLAHAGRKGATCVPWEGGYDRRLPAGEWPILAPSAVPWIEGENQVPKAMTREDMDRVTADFVKSTQLAIEADFDMLEIHMAHGYLLASFISPLTNRRTDAYGGDLAGRMRYPLEVLAAVRAAWPDERPISVRISAVDWYPGGQTAADAVEVAAMLHRSGADIIDVSAGQTVPDQKPVYGRLFQTPFADRIRLEAGIPTMTVGNVSSYEDVNSVLAAGRADLCVLARAHLYDPYWTRHAATELGHALPWPDPYKALTGYSPRFK